MVSPWLLWAQASPLFFPSLCQGEMGPESDPFLKRYIPGGRNTRGILSQLPWASHSKSKHLPRKINLCSFKPRAPPFQKGTVRALMSSLTTSSKSIGQAKRDAVSRTNHFHSFSSDTPIYLVLLTMLQVPKRHILIWAPKVHDRMPTIGRRKTAVSLTLYTSHTTCVDFCHISQFSNSSDTNG